jgi:transcriptional regulator with XRE-family HTH domain
MKDICPMSSSEPMTWRTFLSLYFRRLSSEEKQAFLAELGVSKSTLNRWRRGDDTPKAANLERILLILPNQEEQQIAALLRNDPGTWELLSAEVRAAYLPTVEEEERDKLKMPVGDFSLAISLGDFSLAMMRLQRDTPDRRWQLSNAVLRRALRQLETHPIRTGLEIVVVRCMPPRNGKVRSLVGLVGMGTPPWRGDLHSKDFSQGYRLLGSESLAGYCLVTGHGEMIPDLTQKNLPIPALGIEQEQGAAASAAAFPIIRELAVAGVLLVHSAQAGYFTEERMALIEIFADLIRLSFYDGDFYPVSDIDLLTMPPWAVQREKFDVFRQRVELEYRRAQQRDASSQELLQIQDRVRSQVEEELLRAAGASENMLSH